MRDRRGHRRDRAHLAGQVGGHEVHVVGEVTPRTGDAAHVRLAAQLALRTHLAGHPGHLVRERGQLVDHGVHGAPDAQELASQRPALDLVGHVLGQVALGHRHDDPGDLAGGPAQVVDQAVDRLDAGRPVAVEGLLVDALGHPAFPADHPADPDQLAVAPGLEVDHLVEEVDDLAGHAGAPRQPRLEVAGAHAAQRHCQLGQRLLLDRGGGTGRPDAASVCGGHVAPHGRRCP